jgi:hypothetical protein
MLKQLSFVALATLLLSAVYFIQPEQTAQASLFESWKQEQGLVFDEQENQYRQIIFNQNVAKINKHNSDETQSFKMGVNAFTHLTTEEFVSAHLMKRPAQPIKSLQI